MVKWQRIGFYMVVALLLNACKHPATPLIGSTEPAWPAHFPQPAYNPDKNSYSEAGFNLGKRLFNDKLLSVDGSISCASCHVQEFAFSDAGHPLSKGVNNGISARNTPAVFNMAWNKSFMWDGGVNHIEVMPLAPLTNSAEMGESISNIVKKLQQHDEYPALFKNVFGGDSIDDRQMFWALAQFMTNQISANSKYDYYITGKEALSGQEMRGLALFRRNCAACHKEPLFTDYSFQNNGLYIVYPDSGRYRITKKTNDVGRFKVPTLRNVAVTYPYMHDGSIATLQDVLTHYATGVVAANNNLSLQLYKNGSPGLKLNSQEQEDIVSFLNTLTDEAFLNDPLFH